PSWPGSTAPPGRGRRTPAGAARRRPEASGRPAPPAGTAAVPAVRSARPAVRLCQSSSVRFLSLVVVRSCLPCQAGLRRLLVGRLVRRRRKTVDVDAHGGDAVPAADEQ